MKHTIKVTLFIDVDTEHPEFDKLKDIGDVLAESRKSFQPLVDGDIDGDGMRCAALYVELVE